MARFDPFITGAALVQLLVLLIYYVVRLVLGLWQGVYRSHGGPKPSVGAAGVLICLLVGIAIFVSVREGPGRRRGGGIGGNGPRIAFPQPTVDQFVPRPPRLPALIRLTSPRRAAEASVQPLIFLVAPGVTEIELQPAVPFSTFQAFEVFLDGAQADGFQVRNNRLSLTVDRSRLPAGKHELTVVIRDKRKGRENSQPDKIPFDFFIQAK